MRQVPNGKRSRNRPGRSNNRPQNSRNQSFDSSGPEGKVRGTASQVYEKYLALARDASSSGDRVVAENYFQHAEHYFRIMVASGQQMAPRPGNGFGEEGFDGEEGEGNDEQRVAQPDQPQSFAPAPSRPQPVVQQAQPVRDQAQQPQPPAPRAQAPQPQPQPQAPVAPPVQVEQREPKTPAELAQAAAANGAANGNAGAASPGRPRGRRPGRRVGEAPVEV